MGSDIADFLMPCKHKKTAAPGEEDGGLHETPTEEG
jgi:hypothetical protein